MRICKLWGVAVFLSSRTATVVCSHALPCVRGNSYPDRPYRCEFPGFFMKAVGLSARHGANEAIRTGRFVYKGVSVFLSSRTVTGT